MLKSFFKHWVLFVHDHYLLFLIAPVLLTGLLSIGFVNYVSLISKENMFPYNARAYGEMDVMDRYWPLNDSDNFARIHAIHNAEHYLEVFLCVRDSSRSFTDTPLVQKAVDIHRTISEEVYVRSQLLTGNITYQFVCATALDTSGKCRYNIHLEMIQHLNTTDVTFPLTIIEDKPYYLGKVFARVETNADNIVTRIGCIRLMFYMRWQPEFIKELSRDWIYATFDYVQNLDDPDIKADAVYYDTLIDELEIGRQGTVKTYAGSTAMMITFAVASVLILRSSCVVDWVASQPTAALLGVTGTLMAITSGFGFSLALIEPFDSMSASVPLVAMGTKIFWLTVSCGALRLEFCWAKLCRQCRDSPGFLGRLAYCRALKPNEQPRHKCR